MTNPFPKTLSYIKSIAIESADPLDQKTHELMSDEVVYERASQALRRRFSRGATEVQGIDRGRRLTKIIRKQHGGPGNYDYFILGENGNWSRPDERIWVVAMYALWQDSK